MKSVYCLLLAAVTCGICAFGGDEEQITINSVVATPRYPWNGIWDIVVDISMPAEKSVGLEFEAKDSQTGKRLTCGAVQRSDGGPMLAAAGKTRFVWFTDRDLGPGITEHVTVGVTPVPYMIIDVGGGPDATGYPVSIQYLLDVPASTGWTDEYKTTKIPMRWIRPDVFNREEYKAVYPQIKKNYWIGVFETTQRQYEMVLGLKRGTYQGPMRPVESLTLVEMTNFVASLKAKTGRKFGLPEKDVWEYACRAGTTSLCYDGTSNCVRKAAFSGSGSSVDLGRYASTRDDGKGEFAEHTNVGSYVPNAYGLYDMLGNVGEFANRITRIIPSGTFENTPYTSYDSYFSYVGKGKGDFAEGSYYWDPYNTKQSYSKYSYSSEGEYVHKDTVQYLVFQGGGYSSDVKKVSATASSYNAQYGYKAISYRDLTFKNMDLQPGGSTFVKNMYLLAGGPDNGFRLYCDAE